MTQSKATPAGWTLLTPADDDMALVVPDIGAPDPTQPQAAYVSIRPSERTLEYETIPTSEAAVPRAVWTNFKIRLPLPALVDAARLTEKILAGDYDDLLTRIADGFTERRSPVGTIMGHVTEDARAAITALEGRLRDALTLQEGSGIYGAADYWAKSYQDDMRIRADMTGLELQAIAAAEEDIARRNGVILIDAFYTLHEIREALREAAAE